MKTYSLHAEFNPGAGGTGVFQKLYMKGFYTEQRLKEDLLTTVSPAYGYLNYDAGQDRPDAILDFNREKDGMVSKETPNLGIPSLTYDIYSVTGQGIGAMYRPIRNDIGIVHDTRVESESTGGGVGVDVGPELSHIGVNLSINQSKSTSGAWTEDNELQGVAKFQSQADNDTYEPWNFKVHGELTGEKKAILDNIGGTKAMRVQLGDDGDHNPTASKVLEVNRLLPTKTFPEKSDLDKTRKQRNEVIQTITNEQILNGGTEVINFFQNKYYTTLPDLSTIEPNVPFDRTTVSKSHIAGFTALTAAGLRYNYTIPVYNHRQEELVFSVDGNPAGTNTTVPVDNDGTNPSYNTTKLKKTDKFLKKTETSPYATSYLLTSIVGADYVDLTGDGVSKDDLGYWVKFSYYKPTSGYAWREPFKDAHFIDGWKSSRADDKGSYTFGTKDLWYLARAETKTHIATFKTKNRDDGKGVTGPFDYTPAGTQLALDEIALYSRASLDLQQPYVIKKAKLTHQYLLCGNSPNSLGTNGAKLTLKKLEFFYGNSTRGGLNPYQFAYNDENSTTRKYDQNNVDRWGVYKPFGTERRHSVDFPYADQNLKADDNNKATHKAVIDDNASAWSLKEIITPSGSKITVNYETDDYGYVQHKQAMQMDPVVYPLGYGVSVATAPTRYDLTDDTKIRFKLQKTIPIISVPDSTQASEFVLPYLDQDRGQIAFKVAMNLRTSTEDAFQEYISGYANVELDGPMTLEKAKKGDTFYSYGTFYLSTDGHHPFRCEHGNTFVLTSPRLQAQDIHSRKM